MKTSWTVFNYFVTLHQTENNTKERTEWQPKKEVRSPEARERVVEKRERRAPRNLNPEAAQRSRLRRQPRSLRRRAAARKQGSRERRSRQRNRVVARRAA